MILVGYTVEAEDGPLGTVDRGTYDGGRLVVRDAYGELLRLPVDLVQRIDHRLHTVYLGVSRASVGS